MILRVNLIYKYLILNIFVLTVFAIISTIANDIQNCTIGDLENNCPINETCIQSVTDPAIGQCFCQTDNCRTDPIAVITVKPLPYHSNDNNSNSSSVIISSIFGSVFVILIAFTAYYFGVRKGLFLDIWLRTFTQRQVEHQLLDRSPTNDDNNDSEAIA